MWGGGGGVKKFLNFYAVITYFRTGESILEHFVREFVNQMIQFHELVKKFSFTG